MYSYIAKLTIQTNQMTCQTEQIEISKMCNEGWSYSNLALSELSYWGDEIQLFESGGSVLYLNHIYDENLDKVVIDDETDYLHFRIKNPNDG